jgi:hypothetical protein
LKSYLSLLCLGKNDFDAIEAQRTDAFFARALHLRAVPSSPTLRQRLDAHASNWFDLAERINAAVLSVKIAGTANGGGAPLLFRADSGFDSAKLMCAIDGQAQQLKRAVAFIIKWNPRKTPV